MRRSLLAAVLAIALTSCQRTGNVQPQVREQPKETGILLNVVQHSWDIQRDETLVFLRVYEDGRAEAHPMRTVDFRQLEYKRKQLSSTQIKDLRALLADPETAKLDESYARFWGGSDFGHEWFITLGPEQRTITLVNFQPFLAKVQKKPYPTQLVKIGCAIWRLRVEISGERLDKDFTQGCREWGL